MELGQLVLKLLHSGPVVCDLFPSFVYPSAVWPSVLVGQTTQPSQARKYDGDEVMISSTFDDQSGGPCTSDRAASYEQAKFTLFFCSTNIQESVCMCSVRSIDRISVPSPLARLVGMRARKLRLAYRPAQLLCKYRFETLTSWLAVSHSFLK
mgnify:CR=1 FL=1